MPLSFRNIIDGNELSNAITTGDFSNVLKKPNATNIKYIKGYAQDNAIDVLANNMNINKDLLRQAFGVEKKELDAYDPYHLNDSKPENFWFSDKDSKLDGRTVQEKYDENTNTFKRSIYSDYGFKQNDFWYEDPYIPTFELYFKSDTPLFESDDNPKENSIGDFFRKYSQIDEDYEKRHSIWIEFKNMFFKIFEKFLNNNGLPNTKNKQYYITKITGLNNLNKKIINYGEDKITITLNEDVSMISWYISELYKNLIYSYKNQRYMFPDNVLRFDLIIILNDMRTYQLPQNNNNNNSSTTIDKNSITNSIIKNVISPKSQIIYTLHDCNFNFFESKNFEDELNIGGYGVGAQLTPLTLSFDIIFKSVTRSSNFPLIQNSYSITPYDDEIFKKSRAAKTGTAGTVSSFYDTLNKIKNDTITKKNYTNQFISKATQTTINTGLNYLDSLETKLRNKKGGVINGLLLQFRQNTIFNKIEPDNVYSKNFNDRANIDNFGKQLASGILNNLEDSIRQSANF